MQINGFVWDDTVSTADDAKVNDPRNPLLILLAVLLFAECALLVAATVYLVVELLIATPASLASASGSRRTSSTASFCTRAA